MAYTEDSEEFLVFANFYRRFIENFAKVAQPLTQLTKGKTPWVWILTMAGGLGQSKEKIL